MSREFENRTIHSRDMAHLKKMIGAVMIEECSVLEILIVFTCFLCVVFFLKEKCSEAVLSFAVS